MAAREAVVLLPGMLCDEELWDHQRLALADVADLAVADLTTGETVAGIARSVLDAAAPRFALAGLSLGGIVALEVLRQAPERVTRLALLDTTPARPRPEQLAQWRRLAELVATAPLEHVVGDHLLPGYFHAPDGGLVAVALRMASRVGPAGFVRQLAAQASRPDSWGGLGDVSVPTVVIAGRQDAICPPDLHVAMAAAIPGAALVVVEECGHLSSLEQPEAVTTALGDWLAA